MTSRRIEGEKALAAVGKKAAKKVPHKAAKKSAAKKSAAKGPAKAPGKAAKKGAPGGDARRAFEHLSRLRALQPLLATEARQQIHSLARFAQVALAVDDPRSAAELLRAGEHLAFGTLSRPTADPDLAKVLRDELKAEFQHRMQRAAERWDDSEIRPVRELKTLYQGLRSAAREAARVQAYARALEFARGADALSHVAGAGLTDADPQGPSGPPLLEE